MYNINFYSGKNKNINDVMQLFFISR